MSVQHHSARRSSRISTILLASMAALALNACSSTRGNIAVGDAVCTSPVPPRRTPLPLATPAQRDGLLAAGFSADSVHLADVIGAAGSLLASLDTTTGRNGPPVFNAFASNHVSLSVDRATLEVLGTVAALSCQGARIAELDADLNQREALVARRLALAGIAIGAGAGAVSGGLGFLTSSTPANIAGIVSGVGESFFGVLQLDVSATGHLRLQSNMLEEFWRGPEVPTLFPQRVWRYLNTRKNAGEETPREAIIASWRRDHLIPDEDYTPEPPAVIMKRDGVGTEDTETLQLLYQPLEDRVGLMARSLGRLVEELLERSEAAMLNRQTTPARRRPSA